MTSSSEFRLAAISAKFTPDTLVAILRKGCGRDDAILRHWQIVGENKKGDSYLSTLFKIVVVGSVDDDHNCSPVKEVSVAAIVKSLPYNLCRRKTFRVTDFFANEILFYTKVWPVLDAFQKEKKTLHPFTELPACYAALADGEYDFIALEDLVPQGYDACNRQTALDYEHCVLIVKVLAKFHALSMAYRDQHPDGFEDLVSPIQETYFSESLRYWYETYYNKLLYVWLDVVAKDCPGTVYEEKFRQLVDNDFLGQVNAIAAARGPFAVLTQGDGWIPNFLVKYCNCQPSAIKLIDFQLARVSSPALDLSFFFYTCTEQALREAHWDSLIDEYCTQFAQSLESLGSDPQLLTKELLEVEMKEKARFGLGMAVEALFLTLMDDHEATDLDSIPGSEAVELSTIVPILPIKKPENRQRIADVVKHIVDKGYI